MNLQEWRAKRQRTETMTLPSGLEVVIKPVSMQDLVIQGRVPDTLFSAIDDLSGKAINGTINKGLKSSDLASMSQLMVIICRAAIVEPADLDAEELPFDDRIAIFNRANTEAARLATFPQKRPANGVDAASNGADVRGTAVESTGV